MDVNGSRVRRLTRGSLDTGPSWAPSGRRIVFVRDHGLSILDLAGSRIRSLGVATDSEPGWSPDGRLIAFGSGTKLETVRPDGRGRQTLFDGGDNGVPAEIGRPSWSPDSRAIAVDLLYDHGRWTEESQVIVSTTGQVQATLLCSPPSPPPFEPEYYRLGNMLAWSPDGRWLAWTALPSVALTARAATG